MNVQQMGSIFEVGRTFVVYADRIYAARLGKYWRSEMGK
jgi:hypothetical protein